MNPDTATVSKILRELGDRIELDGGSTYRARAYWRAADNLRLSPVPLDRLVKEGRLKEIPGIGDALAGVITEIFNEGYDARLEAQRDAIPQSVLEMLRIPGLRADRVRKLFIEYGISSVAELEEAGLTLRGHRRGSQLQIDGSLFFCYFHFHVSTSAFL